LKNPGLRHSERKPIGSKSRNLLKKQISRLAFGSLEMTVRKVFNRAFDGHFLRRLDKTTRPCFRRSDGYDTDDRIEFQRFPTRGRKELRWSYCLLRVESGPPERVRGQALQCSVKIKTVGVIVGHFGAGAASISFEGYEIAKSG
jgi:hypothetical protein